jgi:hypothetical protein
MVTGIQPGDPSRLVQLDHDRDRYVAVSNYAWPVAVASRPSSILSYLDAPCR